MGSKAGWSVCMTLTGRTIVIRDSRTGFRYTAEIAEQKESYGRTRVRLKDSELWIEPTQTELDSVKEK